jgi:predicted exporter
MDDPLENRKSVLRTASAAFLHTLDLSDKDIEWVLTYLQRCDYIPDRVARNMQHFLNTAAVESAYYQPIAAWLDANDDGSLLRRVSQGAIGGAWNSSWGQFRQAIKRFLNEDEALAIIAENQALKAENARLIAADAAWRQRWQDAEQVVNRAQAERLAYDAAREAAFRDAFQQQEQELKEEFFRHRVVASPQRGLNLGPGIIPRPPSGPAPSRANTPARTRPGV